MDQNEMYKSTIEGNVCIVDPDENYFTDLIAKNDCVVKFSTTWCGPCIKISPHFHKLCSDRPHMKICLIDCETENGDNISDKYKVKGIPTFLFFKNGELITRLDNANGLDEAFKSID